MRARWSRDAFDQLQPTAPGLVLPLGHLASAQGASCGAREQELQVRAPRGHARKSYDAHSMAASQHELAHQQAVPAPWLNVHTAALCRGFRR